MTDPRIDDPVVSAARAIATIAHRGQTDKLGQNYIEHPRRVAESLNDPIEQAIAWLHDVIEDTDVSEGDLREAGIPEDVIEGVRLMTRSETVPDQQYYAAIRANPHARAVKLADIADNTADWRVAQLDDATRERLAAKYAKARAALGA